MIGRRWWVPWLWLAPALVLLGVFLAYPVVNTIFTSFLDEDSSGGIADFVKDPSSFVGLDNYEFIIENPEPLVSDTHSALLNNALWLTVFTAFAVGFGLVIAVLAARVRYEAPAKAAIFIPMAISFVAASVIWRFMYEFNSEIGTVNAVTTSVGTFLEDQAGLGTELSDPTAWRQNTGSPQTWLTDAGPDELPRPLQINNFALILVGVWIWTGLAVVVLSAGLKGISTEVLEAARVDGASEWQIFWRIIVPILSPTIVVVATTLVIQALKKFDLVWVMTGGRFDTDVVATLFFKEAFVFRDFGVGAALAVVLLLWVVPIMVISIRRFQFQEETR
jgi:alpha-glucoside transport system permease protein